MILRQYCTATSFSPCRLRPSTLVIRDDVRAAPPHEVPGPMESPRVWMIDDENGEGRDEVNALREGVVRDPE